MTMTPRQREILAYLDEHGHATRNAFRASFGEPPTNTLKSLERLGYVKVERISFYGGFPSSDNVRWEITDRGRRAL